MKRNKRMIFLLLIMVFPVLFSGCIIESLMGHRFDLTITVHNNTKEKVYMALYGSKCGLEVLQDAYSPLAGIDGGELKEIFLGVLGDSPQKWNSIRGLVSNYGDSVFIAFSVSKEKLLEWTKNRNDELADTVYAYKRLEMPSSSNLFIDYQYTRKN